jgi:hypothetical protein
MEDNKKSKLIEEQLRKFKHRVDYRVSESAKYHPLISSNEEFDEVPELTNEAGEQEDAPKPEGNEPPAPSNDQPVGAEAPVPAFDAAGGEAPADPMGGDPLMGGAPDPMGAPVQPENQVNDIQNEIIKHNIEAMKSIHDQLEGLNSMVQGLNGKMEVLAADVQEVREPTNSEKLMNKSNVSYPYYFNLNDFWSGNWFNEKREKEMEKGIKEMPDGTFVADFDDLPQKSKIDVQNSFNDFV